MSLLRKNITYLLEQAIELILKLTRQPNWPLSCRDCVSQRATFTCQRLRTLSWLNKMRVQSYYQSFWPGRLHVRTRPIHIQLIFLTSSFSMHVSTQPRGSCPSIAPCSSKNQMTFLTISTHVQFLGTSIHMN